MAVDHVIVKKWISENVKFGHVAGCQIGAKADDKKWAPNVWVRRSIREIDE